MGVLWGDTDKSEKMNECEPENPSRRHFLKTYLKGISAVSVLGLAGVMEEEIRCHPDFEGSYVARDDPNYALGDWHSHNAPECVENVIREAIRENLSFFNLTDYDWATINYLKDKVKDKGYLGAQNDPLLLKVLEEGRSMSVKVSTGLNGYKELAIIFGQEIGVKEDFEIIAAGITEPIVDSGYLNIGMPFEKVYNKIKEMGGGVGFPHAFVNSKYSMIGGYIDRFLGFNKDLFKGAGDKKIKKCLEDCILKDYEKGEGVPFWLEINGQCGGFMKFSNDQAIYFKKILDEDFLNGGYKDFNIPGIALVASSDLKPRWRSVFGQQYTKMGDIYFAIPKELFDFKEPYKSVSNVIKDNPHKIRLGGRYNHPTSVFSWLLEAAHAKAIR